MPLVHLACNDLTMIIYVGNFIDDRLRKTRALPSANPAGTNRMARLAGAIASGGRRVMILGPGAALRMRYVGKLWHPPRVSRVGSAAVLFCPAVGLPVLGALLEPLFVVCMLGILFCRYRVAGVIGYCYYPSVVLAMLYAKVVGGPVVTEDLEDVCCPRLSDLGPAKESRDTRFFQQFVGWFLMRASIGLAHHVIVPAEVFRRFVGAGKAVTLVSGCVSPEEVAHGRFARSHPAAVMRLLIAGNIEFDQGAGVLLECLKLLDGDEAEAGRWSVDVCGYGGMAGEFRDLGETCVNICVKYHGFVTPHVYNILLSEADICFALQNPAGRHALTKVPSKFFEFVAAGKVVCASALPEFVSLPEDVRMLIIRYSGAGLRDALFLIRSDDIRKRQRAANAYANKNWTYEAVSPRLLPALSVQPGAAAVI